MQDNIINCPHCSEFQCYVELENDISSYLCIACGYTTNSLFKIDSDNIDEWESKTPVLIRNSRFLDESNNLIWYPSVLNFPSKGMIFPDGTNENDWKWRVAKVVEIPEADQSKYPIPGKPGEFYKTRVDMESSTFFERNEFKEACDCLGILEKRN